MTESFLICSRTPSDRIICPQCLVQVAKVEGLVTWVTGSIHATCEVSLVFKWKRGIGVDPLSWSFEVGPKGWPDRFVGHEKRIPSVSAA